MSDELIAGRYRRCRDLGRGAMSVVWLADDLVLGRQVAVKRLAFAGGAGDVAAERMSREARAAARLNHPHAVAVYDMVKQGGEPLLIMEYVDGQNLAERISAAGRLSVGEVATIGMEVAGALAAAHELGIVHRDIKPANIMLDHTGRAKIADFGIARTDNDVQLTATGELIGTIEYMAPENVRGGVAGKAADVYSLGATLFAALEGQAPHHLSDQEPNVAALLWRLVSSPAPIAAHGGYLASVIGLMLANEPQDRPAAREVGTLIAGARQAADSGTQRVTGFSLPAPADRADGRRPVEVVEQPSPPVEQPSPPRGARVPPSAGGARPRRRWWIVGVAATAAVAAGVVALVALGDDTGGGRGGSPKPTGTPSFAVGDSPRLLATVGDLLVVGATGAHGGGELRFFDARTRKRARASVALPAPPVAMVAEADSAVVWLVCRERAGTGSVELYDLGSGLIPGAEIDDPTAIALQPAGGGVFVASGEGRSIERATVQAGAVVVSPFVPLPFAPTALASSPQKVVYVVGSKGDGPGTLLGFSSTTRKRVERTPTFGRRPSEVAVSPRGGNVYVVNEQDGTIAWRTKDLHKTTSIGTGPHSVAVNSVHNSGDIYVSVASADAVYLFQRRDFGMSGPYPVGHRPAGMAISEDGTKVFVANTADGTVSVITR